MLTLSDVELRRGPQVLFEHASVNIFRGEKVGIVGRNGCGKSSLLALVRGELTPDAGDYIAAPNLRLAWVSQELPSSDSPLVEYVLDGDVELREIEAKIAAATHETDGARLATLHAEYERIGGYTGASRAAQLVAGLGFADGDLERPIREFSGGLKMRGNLARALMRRSDVLLLDEPTNHLDLDALLWLEDWLRAYPGTLLLVSHDREFLDGVVNRIVHIQNGQLRAYSGNYTSFEVQHAAEMERTQALAEKRQREIAHVQSFVDRFRAKASKARQVQSRIKWLTRLEEIASVQTESDFDWEFAPPVKLPRPLVDLDRAQTGYGSKVVLKNVSLTIEPGDRIGVLGRNGAGKSTLMRTIAAQLAPLGGAVTTSPDLSVGFFAQVELEQLDADSTALEELIRRGGPEVEVWNDQRRRDHLGKFGFRGDRVFEPTRQFSGGERARLTLAILAARRPNLLLLDEPTNHLDFQMRHVLLMALQEFAGAVVVVSHDRALLGSACDRFLLVANGAVSPFDGDLQDYARWLKSAGTEANDTASATPSGLSRKEKRRQEAEGRNRLSPLRAELRKIEKRLEELSLRRQRIEQTLADPAFYTDRPVDERQKVAREHGEVCSEIDSLETQWLQVSEALEGGGG
jgi:ATP-binding cassette, subfamily F, member 3